MSKNLCEVLKELNVFVQRGDVLEGKGTRRGRVLVLLITRDTPIFALFAAVAAARMQRCCWGAAAVPCWGAAGETCAVYVLK